MVTLGFHPFADFFPVLDAELASLAEDIRAKGLRHPIWLFEGKILDGRNRYRACQLANLDPVTYEFEGSAAEALEFVWSSNFVRRHLSKSQAAACVVRRQELAEKLAVEAQRRKAATIPQKGQRGFQRQCARTNTLTPAPKGKTVVALGELAGTSARYVEHARAIRAKAPDELDQVMKGEKTIPQVLRELRRAETRQRVTLPGGKFRVLYADPPWFYSNAGIIGEDNYGHAERHYAPMTIAQLCALDVASLAEDNAVLFLWVTAPLLLQTPGPREVIAAWGFTPKTGLIWDKERHNYGHYVSVRHEHLILATRGSCLPDRPTPMPDSVISIPRSKHSEKPEAFRELIDRLYPNGRRVELFSRRRARNWIAFGNELSEDGDDQHVEPSDAPQLTAAACTRLP